jgi:hypothetical protein
MYCELGLIIITIVVLVLLCKYARNNMLENMAGSLPLSNEAIQNVSNIYNTNNMTVTNLKAGNVGAENITTTTGTVNGNIKVNSIQLGDKWRISGVGDWYANDKWLRLQNADGKGGYGGGIAANDLYAANTLFGGTATLNNATVGNIGINTGFNVNGLISMGGAGRLYRQKNKFNCPHDNFSGQPLSGSTGSIQECVTRCSSTYGSTLGAVTRNMNNGDCWCKMGCTYPYLDNNFDSVIVY